MSAWAQVISLEEARELAEVVEARLGVRLQAGLQDTLANAAAELVLGRAAHDAADVIARVRSADAADPVVRRMTAAAAISETYFFRAPEQLALLRDHVVEHRRASGVGRPLRLWSAACATGEEAYTLAMLFRDHLPRVSVLGTDMNELALEHARAGSYGRRSFRGPPRAELTRGLEPAPGGKLRPVAAVREMVRFQRLNLVTDPIRERIPARAFDVVLLRNVLLYLAPEHLAEVVANAVHALLPGGLLVVTPAEYPLVARTPGLRLVSKGLLTRVLEPEPVAPAPSGRTSTPPIGVSAAEARAVGSSTPPLGVSAAEARLVGVSEARAVGPSTPPLSVSAAEARRVGVSEARAVSPSTPPLGVSAAEARRVGVPERDARPFGPSEVEGPASSSRLTYADLLQSARDAADRGALDEALSVLDLARSLEPDRALPYYLRGVILGARGAIDAGLAELRKALYLDRTFAAAELAVAELLSRQGRTQDARRSFLRAQRLFEALPADGLVAGLEVERSVAARVAFAGAQREAGH